MPGYVYIYIYIYIHIIYIYIYMYNMYIHTITGGVSTITEDISTKQLHILRHGDHPT